MQRIAITGASGYIGTRLVRALAALPQVERIVGLDLRPPALPMPVQFQHVATDVCAPFVGTLRATAADAAVHLAYSFSPDARRAHASRVNVDGTRHFLDACAAAGVRRAVLVSSATAYGARPDNPPRLAEHCPLRAGPSFQYAHEKRLTDELAQRFAADRPELSLAICRPPIVVGSGIDNHFSRLLLKPKVLCVRGHDPPMQFIHEDDLSDAIAALLAADVRGPINVAPPDTLRFSELAAAFERAPLALPGGLLRGLCAVSFALRWRRLNESPAGAVSFIEHPWVVDGGRMEREVGWRARHASAAAVAAWRAGIVARARAGALPGKVRIKKAPPPPTAE
ncbi:MAG: NAD-dependent epimerase/dehydratase family protein [Phycisphaerae bacterium]